MVEQDKPKNLMILMYVVGIIAFLVAIVVVVDQYIKSTMRAEYQKQVLEAPTTALRDLHAAEDMKLNRYTWVDQKNSVVRIPLERASELVLRDWEARPAGTVPFEGAAPATTPGPNVAPAPATPTPTGAPTQPATPPQDTGSRTPPPAGAHP